MDRRSRFTRARAAWSGPRPCRTSFARLPQARAMRVPSCGVCINALISPVAGSLPAGRPVIVVPDGLLSSVPFAALQSPDTGRLMVEDHELQVAPSLALISRALEYPNSPAAAPRVLAVGVAVRVRRPASTARGAPRSRTDQRALRAEPACSARSIVRDGIPQQRPPQRCGALCRTRGRRSGFPGPLVSGHAGIGAADARADPDLRLRRRATARALRLFHCRRRRGAR